MLMSPSEVEMVAVVPSPDGCAGGLARGVADGGPSGRTDAAGDAVPVLVAVPDPQPAIWLELGVGLGLGLGLGLAFEPPQAASRSSTAAKAMGRVGARLNVALRW